MGLFTVVVALDHLSLDNTFYTVVIVWMVVVDTVTATAAGFSTSTGINIIVVACRHSV